MKTEVAFVSPAGRAMTKRPPLAFLSLSAMLEKNGIKTGIIEAKGIKNEKIAMEKTIRLAKKANPEVVGLTCLTTEVLETRKLASEIKKELPDAKIIVGGVHPTLRPEDLVYKKSPVDFAVIGEGEETIVELSDFLLGRAKNKKIENIKGIGFLKNKKLFQTMRRPLIADLSEIPMPDFEKIDMGFYTAPDLYCVRGIPISGFFFFTSRGCPFNCRFCVNKNMFGRTIRYKNPESVVDEIGQVVEKYGIDGFFFYDDTFTVNRKHVEKICSEMDERKLGLIWACETRVNLVEKGLLEKMKKTGCVQIDFGVESGSETNLKRLQKGITVPQIKNAFRLCRESKIRTFANFMINTPGETEEDVRQTILLARELKADVSIFNVTTPYPGNDIYEKIGGVPLEDYKTLGPKPGSFKEWIGLIEKKYKFSEHSLNLEKLLKELSEEFPSIHKISFRNPKQMAKFLNNISFLATPRYLGKVLLSRHRKEYFDFALHIFDYLKEQENSE